MGDPFSPAPFRSSWRWNTLRLSACGCRWNPANVSPPEPDSPPKLPSVFWPSPDFPGTVCQIWNGGDCADSVCTICLEVAASRSLTFLTQARWADEALQAMRCLLSDRPMPDKGQNKVLSFMKIPMNHRVAQILWSRKARSHENSPASCPLLFMAARHL